MGAKVSVITPAYSAAGCIARAVRSVLAQTLSDWEMLIVSDDGVDYEATLADAGIFDSRLRFFSTGKIASGASAARNVALEAARHEYVAILDADDFIAADKLERAAVHLADHGVVSSALRAVDKDLSFLRNIGVGPDVFLSAGAYKFTNFSMDSMLVYDRRRADPRYAADFPHLNDIEFLLKLFAHNEGCFHIGTPLHTYVKEPLSLSNAPGASQRLLAGKQQLISLLSAGRYPLADNGGVEGMLAFYRASLEAEALFSARLAAKPDSVFEDHLEVILAKYAP